jgi:multisubunit Na+/H+ antiporter MnhB subunit
MVNEIGDKLEDKKNEKEPWTINLGKYVTYNPSPFMDKDDLVRKTVIIILIIAMGIAILYYAPGLEIFGILIIGSALFCYALSFYEMNLLEKRTKHELK